MVLDIFTDPETLNDNRKYHDLLYIHKFNHLKQWKDFLKKKKLPKLSQNETENNYTVIIKHVKFITKKIFET